MTHDYSAQMAELPGSELDVSRMPGHWLLARLGKRVLRPGGLELTRALLDGLAIGPADEVVEFAPGLGVTARMILQRGPRRYTGVERDQKAMQWTARQLPLSRTYRLLSAEPIKRRCRPPPPPWSSARRC